MSHSPTSSERAVTSHCSMKFCAAGIQTLGWVVVLYEDRRPRDGEGSWERACQEATPRALQPPRVLGDSLDEGEEAMTRIILPRRTVLLGLVVLLPLVGEAQSQPLRPLIVVGTVVGEGAGHAVFTLTGVALTETGHLIATGTLTGTAGTQGIQETVTAMVEHVSQGAGPGVCTQLLLDLAPAPLARRGGTVALGRVTLDLTAQRGPDALLGQLLCALTSLLDQPAAHRSGIQIFLNAINPRLSPREASNEPRGDHAP